MSIFLGTRLYLRNYIPGLYEPGLCLRRDYYETRFGHPTVMAKRNRLKQQLMVFSHLAKRNKVESCFYATKVNPIQHQ